MDERKAERRVQWFTLAMAALAVIVGIVSVLPAHHAVPLWAVLVMVVAVVTLAGSMMGLVSDISGIKSGVIRKDIQRWWYKRRQQIWRTGMAPAGFGDDSAYRLTLRVPGGPGMRPRFFNADPDPDEDVRVALYLAVPEGDPVSLADLRFTNGEASVDLPHDLAGMTWPLDPGRYAATWMMGGKPQAVYRFEIDESGRVVTPVAVRLVGGIRNRVRHYQGKQ